MQRLKRFSWVGVPMVFALSWIPVEAFHKDVYEPRVPEPLLEELQDMDNPFPPTPENIEDGRKIFFGKGYCVLCHGKDGKSLDIPGHDPRNFTDMRWQEVRTDGEMMWVLKNGSPGTSMPIRVGKVISEEEGWKAILFIRTLAGK